MFFQSRLSEIVQSTEPNKRKGRAAQAATHAEDSLSHARSLLIMKTCTYYNIARSPFSPLSVQSLFFDFLGDLGDAGPAASFLLSSASSSSRSRFSAYH